MVYGRVDILTRHLRVCGCTETFPNDMDAGWHRMQSSACQTPLPRNAVFEDEGQGVVTNRAEVEHGRRSETCINYLTTVYMPKLMKLRSFSLNKGSAFGMI